MRRELCACGVVLVAADGRDWDAIAAMLWRHYRTDQHIGWRLGGVV